MSCRLCTHPQRHQIEAALHAGRSQRQIAAQFGVTKSTLGRHLPHVAWPSPAPVSAPEPRPAWDLAPTPDLVAPLTTAQAQEALTRLQERHQVALAQLETAQAALPTALDTYRSAVWKEKNVRQAQETRDAAQQLVDQLREEVRLLAQGVAAAQLTREEVSTFWQQHKQAHYGVVLTYLSDKYEQWACRTVAHNTWVPHPDRRAAYPDERARYWQAVSERYPFLEGAAPLPPNPHGLASETLVWTLRPFTYAGQDMAEGEVFVLRGTANDDALLRLDYCRQVRPDETPVCHEETRRRFIDESWLAKFARHVAATEEMVHG